MPYKILSPDNDYKYVAVPVLLGALPANTPHQTKQHFNFIGPFGQAS